MRTSLQPLYAVLDASGNAGLLGLLAQCKVEYASLFDTASVPELIRFAPYLVALPSTSAALEPLVDQGWSHDWGIYLTSTAGGGELIASLRRLLISVQPDGQQALLRFYDPRVLRTLLGSAVPQQWPYLFGPVRSYLMPGAKPQTAVGFALTNAGLEQYDITLMGEGSSEKKAVGADAAASAPRGFAPDHARRTSSSCWKNR